MVFSDLLDKAKQVRSVTAFQVVAAASLSAPPDCKSEVEREVRNLELYVSNVSRIDVINNSQVSILVVVPKHVEMDAVSEVFGLQGIEYHKFHSHVRYRQCELELVEGDRSSRLTFVCLEESGNLAAANAVRDYQDVYGRPDLGVLCGMAMGILEIESDGKTEKPRAQLGDVVVAEKVLDFDPRRVLPDRVATRFESYPIDRTLFYDASQHAAIQTGFKDLLTTSTNGLKQSYEIPEDFPSAWMPSAHLRAILAGEALIEDDSGAQIALIHDRLAALEMEGAGFAGTCRHIGVPWLVVRGIADFGTGDRDKRWQPFATAAAASFTKTFLENEYSPVRGGEG